MATRAREFIENHWRENLTLEQIASYVFMSPFHFQRIFKSEIGETPKEYLMRLRIEQAAHKLRAFLDRPVYDIVVDCGFSSQSVFARAFHRKYGMSATEFRNLSFVDMAKLTLWEPSTRQFLLNQLHTSYSPKKLKRFLDSISIKRVEPINVIYAPTTMRSEEHISDEFQAFAKRAAAHDLITEEAGYYGLVYDFPLHTVLDKCRYKVCISVPNDVPINSRFHNMKIDGGRYAVFPVKGGIETMIKLSVLFFNDWLRKRSYEMAELFWFERFKAVPTAETYLTSTREIYAPIKPA